MVDVDRIKRLFEEYGERYIAILNKYEREYEDILDKYYEAESEDERRKIDDEMDELLLRKDMDVGDLQAELEDKLKELNVEVEWNVDYDSWNYFNAPAYPRAYNFYNVVETHAVASISEKTYFDVFLWYKKLNYPAETIYKFDGVSISEPRPLLCDDTPFTSELLKNIPAEYIRDMYIPTIKKWIDEIASAERSGKLMEKLREIESVVKAGLWVYDYAHFYNALQLTKQKFNMPLTTS